MKFSIGTNYKYPTVVRHQGMAIVLALDENRDIYYRVLALDPAQPDDDKSWSDRKKLSFPNQIRPAGMSLVTVGLKTAERTADAPFQAVSDGKHVYLFRQSTDGTLYVDRFVFDPAPQTLNPTWEARFQRNRKRDLPASRKDTLGARDMEGEPFFEPTTELTVVKDLQDGRFCVLLLPGRLPSQWRWQVLATNLEGEIDSFSIRRGEDGLFDMDDVQRTCLKWADIGRRFQTGPAALLYMQQEEAQDEYGRPQRVKRGARVMLAAPVGSSRYALELDGVDDFVSLGNPASLQIDGALTVEAWVKVQATDGRRDIVAHGTDGVSLRIQDGQYQIGAGIQCASYAIPQEDVDKQEDVDNWIHLAGVYDSERGAWLLFRNGKEVSQKSAPTGAATVEEDWAIGKSFAGQINNVRLWNVARTEGEIVQDMHRRLAGDEPGLVGYWPFGEGSGDTAYDRVSENHGQLHVGYFLALDGKDDYVFVEDFEWPAGGPVTVEFWAKVNAADVRRSSAFTVGAQGQPIWFFVHLPWDDKRLCWNYGHVVPGQGWIAVDYSPYLDRWVHVALVSEGKGGSFMGIYLDGALVAERPVSDGPDVPLEGLWIGKGAAAGMHKGEITDFRMWNRVRSADEIQADMHRRLAGDEPGLVGYWPLDEGAGDTIHDRAPGHHDGQLRIGYALEFDGLDDYVELPQMNHDYANGFTVEAWVRYHSFQSWSRIIDFGNGAPGDNILFANWGPTNNLVLQVYRDQAVSTITAPGVLETDTWMHLAATVDRHGNAALYKNGQLLVSGITHVPRTVNRTQNYIGRSNWAADGYFDGDMGEVCVWNVARSQDEIQQDMHGPPAGDEPGPVGYWLFDEGAGETVHDRVSGNHGQLRVGYAQDSHALFFDGVDDYVHMEDFEWPAGGPVTVEFWAKVNAADVRNSSAFTVGAQNDPNRFHVHLPWGNKYLYWDYGDCGGAGRVEVDYGPWLDQWTHVALVSEGNDGKLMGIYLNGELVASNPSSDGPDVPLEGLWIGKWDLAGIHKGEIADFRIWDRVRSAGDIQADMHRRLAGDEDGLVGYWPLDEGSGDTIQDHASEHHGQLCVGVDDGPDKKWGKGPDNPHEKWREGPDNPDVKWGVGPDDPNDKWVVVPPIAILDFAVSRQGTLALIGDTKDLSEVTLALSGADGAATLSIPVVGADATEAAVPMPTIAVDAKGLSVSAGLLNFAHSGDTPFLLDGADGLIHLYFRGDYGQFLVAQHDTLTARAEYIAPLDGTDATDTTDDGPRLHFTGRRPGTQMQGYEIAIADGSDGHTCQVTIDNQNGIREAWQNVPRDLESFLAVLNGTATNDANDPLVQEGELVFYDYGSNVQREGVPDLTSTDNPFFGSTLFAVGADNLPDTGVPIAVRNVDAAEMAKQPGRDCAWIPEPQGKALEFDGADDYVYVELTHDKLAIAGDLAVEAWIRPFVEPLQRSQRVRVTVDQFVCEMADDEGPDNTVDMDRFYVWANAFNVIGTTEVQINPVDQLVYDWATAGEESMDSGSIHHAGTSIDLVFDTINYDFNQAKLKMKAYARDYDTTSANEEAMGEIVLLGNQMFGEHNIRLFSSDFTFRVEITIKPVDELVTTQRIVNHHSEGARFTLGLVKDEESDGYRVFAASEDKAVQTADAQVSPEEWTHLAAVYNATNALKLDGQGYVDCGNDVTLDVTEAVTVEAWVTPEREISERLQPEVILSKWGAAEEEQSWRLYIDTDDKPCFETRDRQRKVIRVKANVPLAADRPYHLAGVFDASPREEMALELDGVDDHVSLGNPSVLNFTGEITIEAWVKAQATDGLRNIVAHGYSPNPPGAVFLRIRDGMYEIGSSNGQDHRTSYRMPVEDMNIWVHLAGVYDGSDWILYRNGIEVSRTQESIGAVQVNTNWAIGARGTGTERFFKGQINNVRIWDRALSIDEIRENMDRPALEVEGAVGHWVFDETDKQRVGAGDTVQDRSGNKNHGTLGGGLTHESFIEVDKCRYEQKIWVNGDLQGGRWITIDDGKEPGYLASGKLTPSDTAIRLRLGLDGQVDIGDCLLLQDEQVVVRQVSPPAELRGDKYYDLVVDRAVNGIAREHRRNTEVYFLKRVANEVALTTAKVNIGRSASDTGYFQGIVDDVRLWAVGRRDWQIRHYQDQPLPGDAEGLVGDWRFEEGRGKTAIDSKGSNHGRLVHPESDEIEHMWTPAARNARLTLYVNGRAVQTSDEELGPDGYGGYGTPDRFTIGAMKAMIGEYETPQQHMSGCIDEVRVWSEVRSPEQIRDNMYRALSGAEEGLTGYWPLDEGEGTTAHDQTGNGQNGTLQGPQWVDSAAPIGNEGPEVRNVYSGLEKPDFNKQIVGPPAAVEYGDMQWDDEGNLFGIMKRCYIFQEDAIQLVTGFKVGDLELNFIGQVQTAPTLVGYIEGAPPVPSENLTVNDPVTDDYVGTSTIWLTEAKETTQVYSASRDTGFDMSVDLKAGVHWATGVFAGLGVQTKVFSSEGKVGLHAYFDHSLGYLSGASKTAGTSKTLTKSLTLGGGWEETQDYDQDGHPRYLNPEVGRRYLPNNMGYALVKSGTADLFALRLKRTGSLVAFQVLPNPDIPEDWNIIMFPLNPKYVKNGTLDGMAGLVADPDYPGAIVGERGSYFKPLEAYALKEQIEREAKKIEGYYENFAAAAKISTGEDGLLSELPEGDWETGRDKRSMANTYVWTADGGFYAEEEQFSSIRQESLGSSYHFLGKGGLYADVKLAAGLGFFFEVDALFGGHINTTVSKSEEEKAAFGLHIDVQGEGFLNRWEGDPDKQQGFYTAEPCPGKVDTYRFMTFYLAPKPQNFDRFFEEIVDPEWLNGQGKYAGEYGPNARALREARSKSNEVWRVLHRVTYVSRVPPRFEPTPVEAVPKDVRRPANLEANIGLIREIERIKRRMPPSPDESHLMILGRAVDRLLFGDASGNGQGQSELEKIVPWWADRDEDVKREIRQDLMTYLKAFYESDLTPPEIEEDKQRVTEGLQVLYTFEEGKGKTVHDVSDVGKPLDLIVKNKAAVSWVPGGLVTTGKTLVATPGPATKLIKAAKASNEITIEAWVKPANATQSGPARIVTLSANTSKRNFTLGQDGGRYQTRLRTTQTNDNGSDKALEAGDVTTDDLSHLVYVRDASGEVRFYLNGIEVGSRKVGGDFSNWDNGYRFGLGNEFTKNRPWRGELHLVAIYKRALGPAEVGQNYNAGVNTTR